MGEITTKNWNRIVRKIKNLDERLTSLESKINNVKVEKTADSDVETETVDDWD